MIWALVCVAALAGCKQSLFSNGGGDDTTVDSGNGDGNGSGDGSVPSSCPATCLADAAADFGMAKWRYLDDNRDRTWTAMTAMSGGYNGSGSNRFSTCDNDPTASACTALPGALLVTTSDVGGTADPALSYTSLANQVVQLSVRVHVPVSAADHTVRVYRNTREDVLFTAQATPGATFERAITLDALDGDRFYLALGPVDAGAQLIGVHFYINKTEDTFPTSCQVALGFNPSAGSTTPNACGTQFVYWDYTLSEGITPMLTAGPIADHGMAADIPADKYYEGGSVLARAQDTTTQLWVRHDAFVDTYSGWVFSDEDLSDADGGGLGIYIYDQAAPKIGIVTCTNGTSNPLQFQYAEAPLPNSAAWHFVRVVHTNGMVHLCVDGARVTSFPAPAGSLQSTYRPHIGKNVVWTPSAPYFDGKVDDVRVLSGALPCDLP